MVLTPSQIINGLGRMGIDVNQAQSFASILLDPNSSPTDKTNAMNQIITNIKNCYQIIITLAAKQGITQAPPLLTDAQLAALGIT